VIIDSKGRIQALAAFPEGGEATLVAEVRLGTGGGTLTTRLGDWAGWAGLAGMAFFTFGSGWLKKKAEKNNESGSGGATMVSAIT
jgi:apolipoprotein N-acyltransferase